MTLTEIFDRKVREVLANQAMLILQQAAQLEALQAELDALKKATEIHAIFKPNGKVAEAHADDPHPAS